MALSSNAVRAGFSEVHVSSEAATLLRSDVPTSRRADAAIRLLQDLLPGDDVTVSTFHDPDSRVEHVRVASLTNADVDVAMEALERIAGWWADQEPAAAPMVVTVDFIA